MKDNLKFFEKMEKVVNSLREVKFIVKENNGGYAVYCKRIIIVPSLPEKSVANTIAEEYNQITEKRKVSIEQSLRKAEDQIEKVYLGAYEDVNKVTMTIEHSTGEQFPGDVYKTTSQDKTNTV